MEVKVVEKEELKVVGIAWNGNYSEIMKIPSLFNVMEDRLCEVQNKTNEPVLIAPFHSRETEFTYFVTAPVEEIKEVPDGMVGFTIPRKNYVFTTHKGRAEEIENTYKKIFAWMKDYGYEQDHQALSLEVYNGEHKENNAAGNLIFDIYLPVRKY
ncbi:hypothetical protein BIV60_12255 [Bacillus sp. MUM 116]|uniref:GyrI-like domain-containing protein n=1 Tax=Bacillus sp. MUM 116 TaxID=1678002 RepID=UPI0008F577B4|nr:GyrI-like domain-containing protein [Bacillus sp. MUM 116]OIK14143.1 hypothetical protein BIV60_12255 [Bacillus sp. MUM 116]